MIIINLAPILNDCVHGGYCHGGVIAPGAARDELCPSAAERQLVFSPDHFRYIYFSYCFSIQEFNRNPQCIANGQSDQAVFNNITLWI